MNIFIYKTNICTPQDVQALKQALGKLEHIARWSVDCEDVDNVLRVESTLGDQETLIQVVNNAGFACEELPD